MNVPQANELIPAFERPARALIGWMAPAEAVLAQSGRQMQHPDAGEFEARAAAARQAVANRPVGVDQADVLAPAPEAIAEHVAALHDQPAAQAMFDEGWEVALADLS